MDVESDALGIERHLVSFSVCKYANKCMYAYKEEGSDACFVIWMLLELDILTLVALHVS